MANVLIVSFAGYPYTPSSLMPDNGLAALGGALAAAGHNCRLMDYSNVETVERLFPARLHRKVKPLAERLFMENKPLSLVGKAQFILSAAELQRHQKREIEQIASETAAAAEAFKADYVGLKLWNGDGFSGAVQIAQAVRARLPKARIIAGGPHVDYFGKHILDYTDAIDFLVAGEGERVLPELIDALESSRDWRAIPGLVRREAGQFVQNCPQPLADLNALPMPDYSAERYPALRGDSKIHIGVLDESRGCPNRCAFCIHPIKSGGKWSLKSPARVTDEMQSLMKAIDSRYFIYSGSNTSAKVAIGIASEIMSRGLDVKYGCFGHVLGIAKADFELLSRSGCRAIFYGIESGSQRILKEAFQKPMDQEAVERIIRMTKEAGICAITSIIYPAPFEDAESRIETLSMLGRIKPDSAPVTIPGMIPGTPWETAAERYGFAKSTRKDLWRYALTYKIKLLYPPSMWKPLPYTLDGKSSRTLLAECEAFIRDLEEVGIVTDVSHELALMAEALGMGKDLKKFRNRCRTLFLSGDAAGIASMVSDINRNVKPSNQPATTGETAR